jgi:hypothetical protein
MGNQATHLPDLQTHLLPRKFVEELKKITPALQEEGIAVGIPPETTLVTLTRAVMERLEHPG